MLDRLDFSAILEGGPIMIPLAIVSLVLWYLIIKELLVFQEERIDPGIYLPRLIRYLNQGEKEKALRLLDHHSGLLSRIFKWGIANWGRGREGVRRALEEAVAWEFPKVGRSISTIGVLASIAPLLGLLGTISGMISTFKVISFSGTGEAELLARGISEALITTQTGLIIGIPGILFYIYLSYRARGLKKVIEGQVERLFSGVETEEEKGMGGGWFVNANP